MSSKPKIFDRMRKGYSPTDFGEDSLISIYKEVFKPLVQKKDLEIFIELYNTNESVLKAWGFLGMYHILKNNPVINAKKEVTIKEIIERLLRDDSIIRYHGGSTEIEIPLREHHVSRICELDNSLVFNPVFDYVASYQGKRNEFIGELIVKVISKSPNPRVEPLILQFAKNSEATDIDYKTQMIDALDNLHNISTLNNKKAISEILRSYLDELKTIKKRNEANNENIDPALFNKSNMLIENILRLASVLHLSFETETLEYLENVKYPFPTLPQIADNFKENEKFKSLLLKKLEETNNAILIKDILLSIIALKEIIQDWKELVLEYLRKYQINDGDLIIKLEEENLYDESMLISYLKEGEDWQLEFVREFLLYYPEKLTEWEHFKEYFLRILKTFDFTEEFAADNHAFMKKKELALKLILELEEKDLLEECLENFQKLKDKELRKLCLFILTKFADEGTLQKLKSFLKTDNEAKTLFKKYWRELNARGGQFYY